MNTGDNRLGTTVARITEITQAVRESAKEAGFDVAGVAAVREFPELDYFPHWIAQGHAGEMKYLEARDEAGHLKRASLKHAAPWARSVVVCAINYNTRQPYSTQVNDPERGWISRYAWGQEDYHDALMRRLRIVENRLHELARASDEFAHATSSFATGTDPAAVSAPTGTAATGKGTASAVPLCAEFNGALAPEGPSQPDTITNAIQTRCYVDTGPLVERVYAKYAGVGWIGKNTCILNQKMGSWLFLGVVLTSIELEPDLPAPDRCGTCTRCIEACPTDALIAPYQLDSTKCISYLTIEKRSSIAEEMRAGMGRHIFGCDICQDVCPWNRKAPITEAQEFEPRPDLVNPALDWLAEMTVEQFRATFRGSPLKRTKLSGIRRNAVIAMGNSGDRRFRAILQELTSDSDPVVADSAAWALAQLDKP
jgi:epoxyqueuosine reductase